MSYREHGLLIFDPPPWIEIIECGLHNLAGVIETGKGQSEVNVVELERI